MTLTPGAGAASAEPRSQLLDSLRDVWRTGDKLLRSCKLYGIHHATPSGFVAELHRKLCASIEAHGPLEVWLTSSEVLVEGEKLLKGLGEDKNWAHALFEAGIVRLRFEKGLEPDEVRRLFRLLASAGAESEDDLGTQMWMESFTHLTWLAMNDLDRADPGDEATAGWLKLVLRILERAGGLEQERKPARKPDLARIAADGLAEVTGVPALPWPLVAKADEAAQALAKEAADQAETCARAAVLLWDPEAHDFSALEHVVLPVLERSVAEGDCAQAARLLERICSGPAGAAGCARLVASRGEALAREALALLGQGKATPDDVAGLIRQLGFSTAKAVLVSAAGLPAKARGPVLAALPAHGVEVIPAVAEALPAMDEWVALEVLAAVGTLPPASLVDLWDVAAAHAAPEVAKMGRSRQAPAGRLSLGRALRALGGADGHRRLEALSYLRQHPSSAVAGALEALIGGDRFKALPMEEKKSLLFTLGAVDPEQGRATARRLFAQKSLLGGQALEEVRAAAALALGELGDRESRSAIELARVGRVGQLFKDSCEQAMLRIDAKTRID